MTKEDRKQYDKDRYKKNKETVKQRSKDYRLLNSGTIKEYNKKYNDLNEDSKRERAKKYYKLHKSIISKQTKIYRDANRNKVKTYAKEYYDINRETLVKYSINKNSEKRKANSQFKLSDNISCLIRQSFKSSGFKKNTKTTIILGCSIQEFKEYMEKQFEGWMNWTNYGKYKPGANRTWNIDHIIPVASANTKEDIIQLNHHTNLRPLCSKENLDKRDNIL